MADLLFRHAAFRKGQREFTQDCWDALSRKGHIMAHVPTGSGKTDAALSAALTYALREDLTVFFLTPKTSQHAIALEVATGIRQKYGADFTAVDFVGKRHLCLEPAAYNHADFYRACQVKRKNADCPFYENYRHVKGEAAAGMAGRSFSHAELLEEGRIRGGCPYELALDTAGQARVVIADYNHVFLPPIRQLFLHRLQKELKDSVLIIDEAHNLFSRLQSALSAGLQSKTLQKAAEEAQEAGEEGLAEQLRLMETDVGSFFVEKLGKRKEAAVGKEELMALVDSPTTLTADLERASNAFLEKNQEARRSACAQVAHFLQVWQEGPQDACARYAHLEKGIVCRGLDVRPLSRAVNEAWSAIAMSGTLLPLEMHRDLLGFDESRTRLKQYASPFPPENRLNVVARGVSTRFKERTHEGYGGLALRVQRLLDATGGRTALFFPSYGVMREVCKRVSFPRMVRQTEQMTASEQALLLEQFEEQEGVLCAVAGGALAEGIDYDRQQIKCVVIVGLPLAQVCLEQEALVAYFEKQFGKGWEYGYAFPAVNKALQAAGRGIRSEADTCAVVFLDERYGWANYKQCFPEDFESLQSDEPWKHVQAFLENG